MVPWGIDPTRQFVSGELLSQMIFSDARLLEKKRNHHLYKKDIGLLRKQNNHHYENIKL
jgi:hypothetical protein